MDKSGDKTTNYKYKLVENSTILPPGEFTIMAPKGVRQYPTSDCQEVVMPDYKDFFYAPWNEDGKAFWVLLNEKEKHFYEYNPEKFKGMIGLIFHAYTENYKVTVRKTVSNGDFSKDQFMKLVRMRVNGEEVTNYRVVKNMLLLEKADGDVYFKPSENNDYVLEFAAHGDCPFPPDNESKPASVRHLRFYGVLLM